MLMEKQGVLALPQNNLKKLIVLRPLRIEGFQDDDETAARELFPGAKDFTAMAPTQRRGKVFLPRVEDGVVVDSPTPLYSLQQSPRFKTLRKRLSYFQNLSQQSNDEILRKLEDKMIGAFFRTLDFLLRFDPGMSRTKLEIRKFADLKGGAQV